MGRIPHLCAEPMKILLVTPAPPRARNGNRITALRWARILRQLGHRVAVAQEYQQQRCDLLVALHARRSFFSVQRFCQRHPDRPLILALTGTDLYGDIHTDPQAQLALELAGRYIVLQPQGINELPQRLRHKARVIYQSVKPPPGEFTPRKDSFEVCVMGHLRPVKDPFRTALATAYLPASSRIQVLHAGAALSPDMAAIARTEIAANPRYRWLDGMPRWQALRLLARCRLLVLSSEMEGGANVVSEALACSVPVLSSHISGSIGLLGADYPGYFPVGDTRALAALLGRAETDLSFYQALQAWCAGLRSLVDPAHERQSWEKLLLELS
jgi:putative glycosyltransferase (TIGR04348 family)